MFEMNHFKSIDELVKFFPTEQSCIDLLVYRKGDNYYTNMECDVEYKTSPPCEYEYVYP